jgi:hypothetical protein
MEANRSDRTLTYVGLPEQGLLFVSNFNQNCNLATGFSNHTTTEYFSENPPVRSHPYIFGRKDWQKDMTNLIVALRLRMG